MITFNEEPLPSNHPFLQMDNVLMTPHNAYNTLLQLP